ncbi:DUF2913 family protein [Trabulsiella odontotermitis]|uniref:DUF2913 family protein n=1 Tax=Trabulsiella odontotermitis TaxID=379893 RepID=UPI0006764371|nr:DUF2913 family protein [Trabulsiella odontotermitis]KNC92834.1 hypothetical protein GM30_14935 [Trabulsiella odontotermitis]
MKKTHTLLSPEQLITDRAHFAWCVLVGLRLAQQEGLVCSPLSIHVFLLRWLATAQRQHRFSRSVAPDIELLLRLGRLKGPSAGLLFRLEYLWQSCCDEPSLQTDLLRLTRAIEYIKMQGWINAAVSDDEWLQEELLAEYDGKPALLVRKSALVHHFADNGKLQGPVDFMIAGNGNVQDVTDVLSTYELCYFIHKLQSGRQMITLTPSEEDSYREV